MGYSPRKRQQEQNFLPTNLEEQEQQFLPTNLEEEEQQFPPTNLESEGRGCQYKENAGTNPRIAQ